MGGNITKTEKILLLCTMMFLLAVCGNCFWEMSAQSGSGWRVETQYDVAAETWISPEAGRININTASVELLTELPGIGETLAARIVEYRDEHGPFRKADALMNVKGIGEKTYHAIADLITVEDAET